MHTKVVNTAVTSIVCLIAALISVCPQELMVRPWRCATLWVGCLWLHLCLAVYLALFVRRTQAMIHSTWWQNYSA